MSVLNKKPYINSVLESLSSENLSALANLMNGLGDRTELLKTMDYPAGNRTNISTSDKGIHLCSLQVGPTLYHGYLIYTDDYCTLLHFTDFNSLSIFNIDVEKKGLETVSEYLDINELRRVAYEISDGSAVIEVSASNIKSTGIPKGQVLKADGSGGAVWGDAGGGLQVLELSSSSGTLTDEQFALASGDNCIIKTSNFYCYKRNSFSGTLHYFSLPDNPIDGEISCVHISINTTTKAYLISDRDIEIYANPTLAGTELALEGIQIGSTKYKVGGASEVVAYEGTSLLPSGVVFEDWTLHRAIKDGNILWIVLAGKITNNSGSSQTLLDLFELTLPSDISSKIYRTDGTTCNNAYTSSGVILFNPGTEVSTSAVFRLYSDNANKIKVQIINAQSLPNNQSYFYNLRIPIFLDIGTVQS